MPVGTYSHYTDPETGEVTLVPQLFPHASNSETTSTKEIEEWVKSGIIPQEVYDEDSRSKERMQDITKRLEKGEQVLSSELPQKPWVLTEFLIKNKASLYGENVLKKIFGRLEDSDPNAVWLSFIKEAIASLSSRDPLPIHFATARKYLKEKHDIEESAAIDVLAREIVDHCIHIQKFKALNHPIFEKITPTPQDLNIQFEDENGEMLALDLEFAEYLKQFGKHGKESSKELKENSKKLYAHYKDEKFSQHIRRSLWSLWVIDPNGEEKASPFLMLLAKVSWESSCASLWNRQVRQSPAITRPIIENIKPILNPKEKKKFITQEQEIVCVSQEGKPLIIAPAIDSDMIKLLQKGVKDLSTLTGHRLLRWQIKTGFEKWSSGETDFRSIEIDGGYSHIADAAGCNSTKEIAKVKAILHAQAYGHFVFHDGSKGNMITLRVLDRYKNNEPSKISIVLGDMLLPGYVFNLGRRDRRLIPIGDLPPLSGSKNTHANQAHLQLLVFEEFSNQSDRLAKEGYVVIPKEKWQEMAFESGLNPNKVETIVTHWCQPDLLRNFLDRQGDEYRLTTYYETAQKFLIYQGEQRLLNSKKGQASAIGKKKGKSKKD